MGIRVTEEAEINGLDMAELGMEAYPDFSKG
jgi:Amt family ammonium transporter